MADRGKVQGKEEESGLRMKPMPKISVIEAMPEEGEIQKKAMVQRREAIGGGEASAELSGEINRARGGGQPLDPGLQQSIGQAMGADFRGVRVHTDDRADRLNRSLSARAFTKGQDLFFKKGEYKPGERKGQELIAHELSHVKQQGKGESIRCWPDPETSYTTNHQNYTTFFGHNAVVFWLLCELCGSKEEGEKALGSIEERTDGQVTAVVVSNILGYRRYGIEVQWTIQADGKFTMANVSKGDIVDWGAKGNPGDSMEYINEGEMRGFNNHGTVVREGGEMVWGGGRRTDRLRGWNRWDNWKPTSVDTNKVDNFYFQATQKRHYGYA